MLPFRHLFSSQFPPAITTSERLQSFLHPVGDITGTSPGEVVVEENGPGPQRCQGQGQHTTPHCQVLEEVVGVQDMDHQVKRCTQEDVGQTPLTEMRPLQAAPTDHLVTDQHSLRASVENKFFPYMDISAFCLHSRLSVFGVYDW